ncbi:hypothetical protein A3D72_01910 [Candidatus Uhrbacteria bacterium RIFCSPHIGHO2_02_FULL_57_19]|uniref:Integrase catalytic domain-containing protein n=1 Tax=Candidatus Uhrbacteria bacterium RIFCSPHIGHO2_02_FULL_57_19 TaxID=1802391 RepID=A0A1F7U442_9BACT|nr:MAG: hypothetical protein A3D72_01910 [Candidatus Uhrbacteria bacterium RIFCSPHIGHO2_02_FULL_57_19]
MKIIPMSAKEVKKLEAVETVRSGRLTQKEAAERLKVTDRCLRYWLDAFETDGAAGLVHGNRGKQSPHRVPQKERQAILSLIRTKYRDFGPTLASEKLLELHGIHRDPTTIRDLMIAEDLWIPRRLRKGAALIVHRAWRERRAHRGELVQFDGSYHPWFENRLLDASGAPAELCLLLAVDDATGEILWAQFAEHEGTLPVMRFWIEYAGLHGLPKAVYLDRFSTYKMTQDVALQNPDLKTQLQRAMKTLGVDLIFALSPQAKGRVERLFKTLQDRLVKELRLRNISMVRDANRFLEKTFIRSFNRKYGVEARDGADFHRTLTKRQKDALPETLCRMEQRVVMNDFTVSFKSQWYQLLPTKGLAIRPKDGVLVREYPDAAVSFSIRDRRADVQRITKRTPVRRQSINRPTPTLVPA